MTVLIFQDRLFLFLGGIKMDFEKELKNLVKHEIMEVINGAGIKAVVREKITELGEMSKDDMKNLITNCVDSYVRSFDIEKMVDNRVEQLVECRVKNAVNESLKKYMDSTYSFTSKPNKLLDSLVSEELKKQYEKNYKLKVVLEKSDTK